MIIYNNIKFYIAFLTIFILLNGCSMPKLGSIKPGTKPITPNANERAQENVRAGKGFSIFGGNKSTNGNFQFASSNPMWKSALDVLSFASLANSDYSGGVIITDWYSQGNPNEAIKITIRFLSNEIRADGMIVNLYKRNCVNNVCSTKEIKSDLVFEIKDKILKKAALYKEQGDKIALENRPEKVFKGDKN